MITIVLVVLIITLIILAILLLQSKCTKCSRTEGFNEMFDNVRLGLNRIDKIYYINLENRPDRKKLIEEQLSEQNVDKDRIHRIDAYYTPNNGHYGCAKSHVDALKDAILHNYKNILILEDDFHFNLKKSEISNMIDRMFNEVDEKWDIILLARINGKLEDTKYDFLDKVNGEASTASGYIVNNHYYQILLDKFQYCVDNMIEDHTSQKGFETYAIDQQWKELQNKDKWYSTKPLLGSQDGVASSIQATTKYEFFINF